MRGIDESGEDYLYPKTHFVLLDLPENSFIAIDIEYSQRIDNRSSELMSTSPSVPSYQRLVLKLGTSVLTAGSPQINRSRLLELVRQCAKLHAAGVDVVVVTSAAIAAGRECWGFASSRRPCPSSRCWPPSARFG